GEHAHKELNQSLLWLRLTEEVVEKVKYFYNSKQLVDLIIFHAKDAVSESQFNQVLNIELDQIIEGTSRPTHYHVLLDEIGFSPHELQELLHSLSYV
ncbi:hypothetical protein RYX36_006883, partial [Vicia faba]